VVVAAIYQTGRFGHREVIHVWGVLAGATVGLMAQALGRLYSSTYYALRDTRTPLRFAIVRVLLTCTMGYLFALRLPGLIGLDPRWGVACLTTSSSLAAWVEFILLRRRLNHRIGPTGLQGGRTLRLFLAAALAAAAAWGMRTLLPPLHPILLAMLLLSLYGVLYIGGTLLLRAAEITPLLDRLQRKRRTS